MLGRFSEAPDSDGNSAHFVLPDLRDIWGILHSAPEGQEVRLFQEHDNWPSDITDEELLAGPLAYFGRHNRDHVRLALDPDINWIEQTVPPESSLEKVHFTDAEGKVHSMPLECFECRPLPEGAEIFEADWSHRHCSFCMQRIESGEIGNVAEYPNRGSDWVCRWCFANAVSARNLRPLLIPVDQRRSL